MKKFLLVSFAALFTLCCINNQAQAQTQDYTYALGVRGSYYPGITFKFNFNSPDNIELIGAFKKKGFDVTALYERYVPVIGEGFHFYYGAGVNLGSWKKHDNSKFTMGVDGIVGLEYKVRNAPITFALDYKPQINFVGHDGFLWEDFALSIRFVW